MMSKEFIIILHCDIKSVNISYKKLLKITVNKYLHQKPIYIFCLSLCLETEWFFLEFNTNENRINNHILYQLDPTITLLFLGNNEDRF